MGKSVPAFLAEGMEIDPDSDGSGSGLSDAPAAGRAPSASSAQQRVNRGDAMLSVDALFLFVVTLLYVSSLYALLQHCCCWVLKMNCCNIVVIRC